MPCVKIIIVGPTGCGKSAAITYVTSINHGSRVDNGDHMWYRAKIHNTEAMIVEIRGYANPDRRALLYEGADGAVVCVDNNSISQYSSQITNVSPDAPIEYIHYAGQVVFVSSDVLQRTLEIIMTEILRKRSSVAPPVKDAPKVKPVWVLRTSDNTREVYNTLADARAAIAAKAVFRAIYEGATCYGYTNSLGDTHIYPSLDTCIDNLISPKGREEIGDTPGDFKIDTASYH